MAKKTAISRSNEEIRKLLLQYFYDRNQNATSARGKKGTAATISVVKSELKAAHGLTQQQIQSNLTYLISQGWVEEHVINKSITTAGGTVIPSSKGFYQITAPGIDKIEWLKPVYPGDTLFLEREIVEKRSFKSKPEMGLIKNHLTVFNQDSAPVMSMVLNSLVKTRPV